MSDQRPYRDDSLSMDDRRPPPRRGAAPVTLIVSVLLLLGVVGGVAWLYRDGVRGPSGPPQPVGAPIRDVRTLAPSRAETADPAAGLSIYKDDPNATAAPQFSPPPEQPAARASVADPPTAAPTAPASAKTVVEPVQPAVAATPAPERPVGDKSRGGKPLTIDKIIAQSDGDDTPKVAAKAVVQIGAFSSEDLADKAWREAVKFGGPKMAGKGRRIVPLQKDGAALFRVAATGFASKEDAQAVCDRLKAAGKPCFVR